MVEDVQRIPWLDGSPPRTGHYWWAEKRGFEGFLPPRLRKVYRAPLHGELRLVCEMEGLGVLPVDAMPGVWAGPLPGPERPAGELVELKFGKEPE